MTAKVDFKNLYEIAEEQSKEWFELCIRYKKRIEELESQASDKDKEIDLLEEREMLWSSKVKNLEDEIERLKGLIEEAFRSQGRVIYEQFKKENNL